MCKIPAYVIKAINRVRDEGKTDMFKRRIVALKARHFDVEASRWLMLASDGDYITAAQIANEVYEREERRANGH